MVRVMVLLLMIMTMMMLGAMTMTVGGLSSNKLITLQDQDKREAHEGGRLDSRPPGGGCPAAEEPAETASRAVLTTRGRHGKKESMG